MERVQLAEMPAGFPGRAEDEEARTAMIDLEGRWRGRPAPVWTLAVLMATGAGMCAVGAVAPPSPQTPVMVDAVLAVTGAALASWLWLRTPRTAAALHLGLVFHVLGTTTIVASAATGEGALSSAFSYLLIAMYVGVFLERRAARCYLAVSAGSLAVALMLSDVVTVGFAAWLPPAVACLVAGELLGWLTARMRALGLTDPLTGLPNRAGFEQAARRALAVAGRTRRPLTIVVADLNDFKRINDAHGHAVGDEVLSRVSREWRTGLRPGDVVCRRGGDEFALILPDTSEDDAAMIMARLQASSSTGWSFGVAALDAAEGIDSCVERADRRMYQAKAGRSFGAPDRERSARQPGLLTP